MYSRFVRGAARRRPAAQRRFFASPSKTPAAPPRLALPQIGDVIPVQFFKDHEVTIQPDNYYPPWLWTLLEPKPTLQNLQERIPASLSKSELRRLLRLNRRAAIKANNVASKSV